MNKSNQDISGVKIYQLSEVLKQLNEKFYKNEDQTKKIEKYVTNMNTILQKMTQKLEIMQIQNVKNTMKYNSFKQQYQKSLSEEVQKRTATIKQEFIKIDELTSFKIALKEYELKIRNKIDKQYVDNEINKINKEISDKNAINQEHISRIKTQLDVLNGDVKRSLQQNKKKMNQTIDSTKLNLTNTQKKLSDFDKDNKYKLQSLRSELNNTIIETNQQLDRKINITKQQITQQLTNQTVELKKRLYELIRLAQQNQKKNQKNLTQKIQEVKIIMDKGSNKLNGSIEKISKILNEQIQNKKQLDQKNIKVLQQFKNKLQSLDLTYNQNKNEMSRNLGKISQKLNQLYIQFNEKINQNYLSKLLKDYQSNHENTIPKQQFSITKRTQQFKKTFKSNQQQHQTNRNYGMEKFEELEKQQSSDTQSHVNPHQNQKNQQAQQKLKQINKIKQTQLPEIIQKKKNNLNKDETQDNQQKKAGPYSKFSEHNTQIRNLTHGFKEKVDELSQNIIVLKEIIESKANQSDLLKLYQSKCTKFAFKELIRQLVLFKNIIETLIPHSEVLKEFHFDDQQYKSVYTKLAKIKHDSSEKRKNQQYQIPKIASNLYQGLTPRSKRNRQTLNILEKIRIDNTISSHSSRLNHI